MNWALQSNEIIFCISVCIGISNYNYSVYYFLRFLFQPVVAAITIGLHFSTCICRLVKLSGITLCSSISDKYLMPWFDLPSRARENFARHIQRFDPVLFHSRNLTYLRLILNWLGDWLLTAEWLRSLVSDVLASLSAPALNSKKIVTYKICWTWSSGWC